MCDGPKDLRRSKRNTEPSFKTTHALFPYVNWLQLHKHVAAQAQIFQYVEQPNGKMWFFKLKKKIHKGAETHTEFDAVWSKWMESSASDSLLHLTACLTVCVAKRHRINNSRTNTQTGQKHRLCFYFFPEVFLAEEMTHPVYRHRAQLGAWLCHHLVIRAAPWTLWIKTCALDSWFRVQKFFLRHIVRKKVISLNVLKIKAVYLGYVVSLYFFVI